MSIIFIQNKTYKEYKNSGYFCNEDGDIYSNHSHKIIKPLLRGKDNKKYYYVDINFGKGQKHYYIHKIVYETWIGEIPDGMCVLHKDDDHLNNNINNLYLGTQKENIQDCLTNNHRVGNTWILTIFDKEKQETITFCPASKFIEYSGHSANNGSVNRMFSKNWFKVRYEIIDYYRCKSRNIIEDVTTKEDECTLVGQTLSLPEVRDTIKNSEDIV